MKKFAFSLERMQRYKKQMVDKEKQILAALQKQKADIIGNIEHLEQFEIQQTHQLQQRQIAGMQAQQLAGYSYFSQNIRTQIASLRNELEQLQPRIDAQIEVVKNVSQELKSIDKLEEKKLEEYQLEVARAENEQLTEYIVMGI